MEGGRRILKFYGPGRLNVFPYRMNRCGVTGIKLLQINSLARSTLTGEQLQETCAYGIYTSYTLIGNCYTFSKTDEYTIYQRKLKLWHWHIDCYDFKNFEFKVFLKNRNYDDSIFVNFTNYYLQPKPFIYNY